MKCYSYDTFFEVISHKIRLRIIELLRERPMCVSEICDRLSEEQSKVSHNLRKLTDCHFVNVRQDGKNRIYSLNSDTIMPIMNLVKNHVQRHCCNACFKRVRR